MSIAGLAGGLSKLGHDVEPVRPAPLPFLPPPGTVARRIGFNLLLPLRFDPGVYDLVVSFDLDGFLLAGSGTPLAVCLKGVAADEAKYDTGRGRLDRLLAGILEGRSARRAHVVVVPSRYSAGAAVEAYGLDPARIAVVPEGIDLEPWNDLRNPDAPPPWDRPPVILNVARQYRRKNTAALLRALPRVREAVPEARVRIVGGGPELPRLRRLARELGVGEAVEFLGELEKDRDVRREYLTAAAFCLPSRQEGFGIVLLEAMAAGLPIVAGNAGAIPEVAPPDEVALLVDPEEPGELARALVRILSDRSLARALAGNGTGRVRGYEIESVAERFLLGVNEILGS